MVRKATHSNAGKYHPSSASMVPNKFVELRCSVLHAHIAIAAHAALVAVTWCRHSLGVVARRASFALTTSRRLTASQSTRAAKAGGCR
jgi:hypothetical protein